MSEYNLSNNETLTKIHTYELNRPTSKITINIHELIFCSVDGTTNPPTFIAAPYLPFHNAKEAHVFNCQSEHEALVSCLNSLSGVDGIDVFVES